MLSKRASLKWDFVSQISGPRGAPIDDQNRLVLDRVKSVSSHWKLKTRIRYLDSYC